MAEFDIILWGATGYTGRLTAAHLLKTYGAAGDLKWAMAGRSAGKLAEVKAEIGAPANLPTVIADSADRASLDALVGRTSVVISTVGPYQLYGSPLVAACAAAGTDYVDLTGEANWMADMLGAHDAAAKASGARIVFACGFDSIPFDLGVFFAEAAAKARFGAYAPRVRGRVRGLKGGLSGGTAASMMAMQAAAGANPAIGALLLDPFALTPGFRGAEQPDGNTPYEDKAVGAWVGPFMMAAINTKIVHRSNVLLGRRWGDLQYDEMQMLPGPPGGDVSPTAGFTFGASGLPKPGEGPTREERETGFYDILFVAELADGRSVRAAVKGDMDPGYGSTSKMLGEAAVCLARDVPKTATAGGCWTPAAAMGEALIRRLQAHAGLTFTVES
jgi:short subunit dehydrogenase-like uncharacterized protein